MFLTPCPRHLDLWIFLCTFSGLLLFFDIKKVVGCRDFKQGLFFLKRTLEEADGTKRSIRILGNCRLSARTLKSLDPRIALCISHQKSENRLTPSYPSLLSFCPPEFQGDRKMRRPQFCTRNFSVTEWASPTFSPCAC